MYSFRSYKLTLPLTVLAFACCVLQDGQYGQPHRNLSLTNYLVLHELWEFSKDEASDPSMKAHIIGVEAQFKTFTLYFGAQLGFLLLQHSDNLSKTLQLPVDPIPRLVKPIFDGGDDEVQGLVVVLSIEHLGIIMIFTLCVSVIQPSRYLSPSWQLWPLHI